MRVIVPCAGSSSRFPNMPPKWMLPDHDGIPMVVRSVEGLGLTPDRFVFTVLRDHVDRFNAVDGLRKAFGHDVECVVLDTPTASQSETVAATLRRIGHRGSFLVKDSDNTFSLPSFEDDCSYISVASLHDFDLINARNKSYVQVDQDGLVVSVREKQVISDLFSVGGYFFREVDEFLQSYDDLISTSPIGERELYLSDLIAFQILNGEVFRVRHVNGYKDWGTVHEWRKELEGRRVFLVSIDGFIFQRGSNFFSPHFAEARINPGAAEAVRKMADERHTIIYLSVRPPDLEQMTRKQLTANGLPEAPIIFGCGVAQWSLVTSAHPTLPFNTSQAHELDAGDINLLEKLHLLA